jgi:hypothetical protein
MVGEVLYLAYLLSKEDAVDYLSSLPIQKDPTSQKDFKVAHIP